MLRISDGTDPFLRRPFSFNRIFPQEGSFEILYRVTGRGTWVLSHLTSGTAIDLIGPLGNGFQLPKRSMEPIAFVAGGIGIAPLEELIIRIIAMHKGKSLSGIHLFYGARNVSELLPDSFIKDWGIPYHFATDDGSYGYNGRITRLYEEFTARENFQPIEIYSCGPLAMQYHVAKWALFNNVSAQLSLESLMGCGIGACLGCALPAAGPGKQEAEHFVHVCEDGPIFSAGSIKWNQILVQQTPRPTYLFS